MDGNRRYARGRELPKRTGHERGYARMLETLLWCSEAGLSSVNVFAFSIDNFRRSDEEVRTLMELAAQKFDELVNKEWEFVQKHDIHVRVAGDLALLPPSVQQSMARVRGARARAVV